MSCNHTTCKPCFALDPKCLKCAGEVNAPNVNATITGMVKFVSSEVLKDFLFINFS